MAAEFDSDFSSSEFPGLTIAPVTLAPMTVLPGPMVEYLAVPEASEEEE